MIQVWVKRGPADRQGSNITGSLFTSEAVARARGETAINKSYPAERREITLSCGWLAYCPPGSMVRVILGREAIIGRLKSFSREIRLSGSTFTADTKLVLEVIG